MRVEYEDITEAVVGQRLVGLAHTDAPISRDDGIVNDELAADPPPISFVAMAADGAIAIGVGEPLRGLGQIAGDDDPDERRRTPIDQKVVQGFIREFGVGAGGWIEVVE